MLLRVGASENCAYSYNIEVFGFDRSLGFGHSLLLDLSMVGFNTAWKVILEETLHYCQEIPFEGFGFGKSWLGRDYG